MSIDEIKAEVIRDIETHAEWHEEVSRGKMFGILIVEPADGQHPSGPQYLKAYSGQILGRSDWEGYVPAIFDYLQEDGYFKQHEAEITAINNKVREQQALLPPGKRTRELEELKAERKERSNALQRWLFSQFRIAGSSSCDGSKERSILEVFQDYAKANNLKQQYPPGGTGECCAPKLLHYANKHGMKPLQLMEFWYGASPKGEIRHHGMVYEPCQAKCMPILWYMAPKEDFTIHGSALHLEAPQQKTITEDDIIYEDEWLIAINKPAGLLSVPGKRKMPNAESMLMDLRCKADSGADSSLLKMVHRLDMDTSGVLLAAKTQEVFVEMQKMFALHEKVHKEYVALLATTGAPAVYPEKQTGTISIPLSPDFLNRPRQCVDYEKGKEAVTEYDITGNSQEGFLRITLNPLTGRTHQLRIHCAHTDGLGMPIVGDPLYGNVSADRMYLHAESLRFIHPVTGKETIIKAKAPF